MRKLTHILDTYLFWKTVKNLSTISIWFLLFLVFTPNVQSQDWQNDSLYLLYLHSEMPDRASHLEDFVRTSTSLDPMEAVEMLKTEIATLEQSKEYPIKLSHLYYLIFDRFRYAHKYQEGSPYITKIIKLISEHGNDDSDDWNKVRMMAYQARSSILRWDGKKAESAAELEKALKVVEQLNDTFNIGATMVNLGIIYSELGDSEKAVELYTGAESRFILLGNEKYIILSRFFKAIDLFVLEQYHESRELFKQNLGKLKTYSPVHHIAAIRTLGEIETLTGNLAEAELLLDSAYNMVIKTSNHNSISLTASRQVALHKKKGDYKKALEFLEIRGTHQDSMFQQILDEKNTKAKAEYEDLSKTLRIKELEQEKALSEAKLKNQILLLLAGAFLLIALLGLRLFRQRQKAKLERAMREKEQELSILKERLFTNITHDLRTPLSLIISPLQELLPDQKCPARQRKLQLALKNSRQLLHLVNQILDWHSLDAKVMQLAPSTGELRQAVNNCTERFKTAAIEKNIRLDADLPPMETYLHLDFDKLDKILTNLLANALKFTSEGGIVLVRAFTQNESLTLQVSDTGKGIPEKELGNIFRRFRHSKNEQSAISSGIGLALVSELAELMGGQASVRSELGEGSTFMVKIPVEKMEPNAKEQVLKNGNTPTVFLVEDNFDLRGYLVTILQKSFHVKTFPDAEQALEGLHKELPDLIVTDLMMPGMCGISFCQKIKSDPLTNHLPVLLLTAKSAESSKLDALEAGADAWMGKPFEAPQLLAQLQNLLHNRTLLQEKYCRQMSISFEKNEAKVDDPFLENTMKIVLDRLQDDRFSVEDLAKESFMSRVTLAKKLKSLTGKTPVQFIRDLRLEKGKSLLATGQANISEVAFQVGFSDPNYFSVCFKDYFGESPSDWKKSELV